MTHGKSGVSCGDCYFRQELLCALQVDKVCPTFRATVGRAPARPRQAQLVPVPQLAMGQVVTHTPRPSEQPRYEADVFDVSAPVPSLVFDGPADEPFSSLSPESTFSVREAAVGEREMVTAGEASNPRPAMRAAAARRDRVHEIVIPLDDEPADFVASVVTVQRPASPATTRASRIAERIARRYPNATAIAPC